MHIYASGGNTHPSPDADRPGFANQHAHPDFHTSTYLESDAAPYRLANPDPAYVCPTSGIEYSTAGGHRAASYGDTCTLAAN